MLVVSVGAIVAAVGVVLAFLAASSVNNIYAYQASVRAEAVAVSGAEDALLQLARNITFNNTGGYNVTVGSSTATVTVTQNSPSAGLTTVLSTATVLGSTRKIQVVVSTNASVNQTNLISWSIVQ